MWEVVIWVLYKGLALNWIYTRLVPEKKKKSKESTARLQNLREKSWEENLILAFKKNLFWTLEFLQTWTDSLAPEILP